DVVVVLPDRHNTGITDQVGEPGQIISRKWTHGIRQHHGSSHPAAATGATVAGGDDRRSVFSVLSPPGGRSTTALPAEPVDTRTCAHIGQNFEQWTGCFRTAPTDPLHEKGVRQPPPVRKISRISPRA